MGVESCAVVFPGGHFQKVPIHLFIHFCCTVCPLATIAQRHRQTDDMMPTADQSTNIILISLILLRTHFLFHFV